MKKDISILYYSVLFLFFIVMKLMYTKMDNSDLHFLLNPTHAIVTLLTGSTAIFCMDKGFFFENLNIAIDKSCSGFNFWILSFIMLSYVCVSFYKTNKSKLLAILVLFAITFFTTIFVNTSRIMVAIFILKTFPKSMNYTWLHQMQGIFIYLSFLILLYITITKLIIKKK